MKTVDPNDLEDPCDPPDGSTGVVDDIIDCFKLQQLGNEIVASGALSSMLSTSGIGEQLFIGTDTAQNTPQLLPQGLSPGCGGGDLHYPAGSPNVTSLVHNHGNNSLGNNCSNFFSVLDFYTMVSFAVSGQMENFNFSHVLLSTDDQTMFALRPSNRVFYYRI